MYYTPKNVKELWKARCLAWPMPCLVFGLSMNMRYMCTNMSILQSRVFDSICLCKRPIEAFSSLIFEMLWDFSLLILESFVFTTKKMTAKTQKKIQREGITKCYKCYNHREQKMMNPSRIGLAEALAIPKKVPRKLNKPQKAIERASKDQETNQFENHQTTTTNHLKATDAVNCISEVGRICVTGWAPERHPLSASTPRAWVNDWFLGCFRWVFWGLRCF